MTGLVNLANQIQANWASVTVVIGVVVALYFKVKQEIEKYRNKSEAEKQTEIEKQIEIAKKAVSAFILSYMADAEELWRHGEIKRAEVIQRIYSQYPIFNLATDQDELVKYLDSLISNTMNTIRKTLRNNSESQE